MNCDRIMRIIRRYYDFDMIEFSKINKFGFFNHATINNNNGHDKGESEEEKKTLFLEHLFVRIVECPSYTVLDQLRRRTPSQNHGSDMGRPE